MNESINLKEMSYRVILALRDGLSKPILLAETSEKLPIEIYDLYNKVEDEIASRERIRFLAGIRNNNYEK